MEDEYDRQLAQRISAVFAAHGTLMKDHRPEFGWMRGFLGDPRAGVWFVSEAFSRGAVEKAVAAGAQLSPDDQWTVTAGDKIFRDMLVKYGFKTGQPQSKDGWRCYITNVMKDGVYVEESNESGFDRKLQRAIAWAPILDWELKTGRPKLLVVMGNTPQRLIDELVDRRRLPQLPTTTKIWSYAYVGQRPGPGRLRAGDPQKVAEYDRQFSKVAAIWNGL